MLNQLQMTPSKLFTEKLFPHQGVRELGLSSPEIIQSLPTLFPTSIYNNNITANLAVSSIQDLFKHN